MEKITKLREFMKSQFDKMQNVDTDQSLGRPQPGLEKPAKDAVVKLPPAADYQPPNNELSKCIKERRSRRKYTNAPLSLEELSYLLWTTQGVKQVIKRQDKAYATLRTVPSAGARHPFETYLFVHNVTGLHSGIYRYIATNHELEQIKVTEKGKDKLIKACLNQNFCAECAVTFAWSVVPERGEWRYSITAHKVMLIDIGHVCENLYLAAESIGCGTCGIGAYDQKKMDGLLGLDGENEFVIYLAPVGKI
jgi:SagB-type dehydrogenase family enzyme